MTDISFGKYKGLDSVILSTPYLRAEWLPEYGSKLCSLKIFSGHDEIELLYQSQQQTLALPPYNANFCDFDMSGFDECFPTIASCTMPGTGLQVPDHGEVWALPWHSEILDDGQIMFSVHSHRFKYTLSKSITLEGNQLQCRYQLSLDKDAAPLPYMWTPHALFAATPQTRLIVPSHMHSVTNVCNPSPILGPFGEQHNWPKATTHQGVHDLAQLNPPQSGLCDKFYFDQHLQQGDEFGFENDSVRVMMSVDHEIVPWLSIWKNQGGFHGHYNFALEPCTAGFDSIAEAASKKQCQVIKPGEDHKWHLNIKVSAARAQCP
ncbi:hypothetical protein GT360_15930 [Vibrio astriarenae]|uniref:DUF4432 family protein n=1 Tax=Vibrio astriarenae TaxID=1481923 RepID=A0A7Z2T6B3_9VIBR|nr:DUF4432 family protein [Vibrio astriarenae]QIA65051.1 hypothetical protein GT360_15930 [Vibrio astriarenae]